jgi:oligopeptide transport system ATP-binding protein
MSALRVEGIEVAFGDVRVLRGISFHVESGETLGIVGESGCGKSMTGLTIMGMIPGRGRLVAGSIRLDGRELAGLSEREWQQVRGQDIAMVMQDPFTSLNPMHRIGAQIAEVLRLHRGLSRSEARREAVEMLRVVGVPAPELAARKYPHQLSGGQRQRVVIAIAFACHPKVLIADEPTTALDVTLQAQILRLIRDIQAKESTAVILISHDIGVIGSLAKRIAVFYAGRIVEIGEASQVLFAPKHPYTQALLAAMPRAGERRLRAIGGQPPDLAALPVGCPFGPRCAHRMAACVEEPPLLPVAGGGAAACWLVRPPMESLSEAKSLG